MDDGDDVVAQLIRRPETISHNDDWRSIARGRIVTLEGHCVKSHQYLRPRQYGERSSVDCQLQSWIHMSSITCVQFL
jgi:hypothetical protein